MILVSITFAWKLSETNFNAFKAFQHIQSGMSSYVG